MNSIIVHWIIRLAHLQCESPFCFGRRVCRLSVPRQISKIKRDSVAKFRHSYRKSLSERQSKNITSDFAPEVAK